MFSFLLNAMESPLLSSQHFAVIFPVGAVIILAVLIFAFGFKSSVEPPSFKHISFSTDEKKNPKKKKIKDKKPQSNGHAAVVIDVPEAKKSEPTKTGKQTKIETPKQKKQAVAEKVVEKKAEPQKSPAKKEKKVKKENVDNKGKKGQQNAANEKPADFDEGEWEVAPSRKDKKNKKKEEVEVAPPSPDKGSKKKNVTAPTKKDAEKIVPAVEPKPVSEMPTVKLEDILPKEQIALIKSGAAPTLIEAPVAPVPAETQSAGGDQAAKKKKKKATKSESVAVPEPEVAEAVAPTPAVASEPVQVFNELEDVWQEAPQKKSKKKARKD